MGLLEAEGAPSRQEAMAILGARALAGCRSTLVGIGLPNLAATLCKRLYNPGLTLVYESGVVDAGTEKLALSIGDAALVKDAASIFSMFEVFAYFLGGRRIDVGFVGAAQVGRQGELNATVIGDYAHPKVRLPGSGGASEIALCVSELIVLTAHERRRFPETVDFVTSRGAQSMRVITDLASLVLVRGELVVDALMDNVSREQVRAETGWPVRFQEPLRTVEPVSAQELAVVRQLDDRGLYR
jgi:glutaconate CoA-transferase subunit B